MNPYLWVLWCYILSKAKTIHVNRPLSVSLSYMVRPPHGNQVTGLHFNAGAKVRTQQWSSCDTVGSNTVSLWMLSACSLLSLVRGVSVGVRVFTEQLRGVSNRCGVALSSDLGGYLRMICRGNRREQLSGGFDSGHVGFLLWTPDWYHEMKWKSPSVYLAGANIHVRPATTAGSLDWTDCFLKTQQNSTLRRYIVHLCCGMWCANETHFIQEDRNERISVVSMLDRQIFKSKSH